MRLEPSRLTPSQDSLASLVMKKKNVVQKDFMRSLLRTSLDINICTFPLFGPPFNVGSGRDSPVLRKCSAVRRTLDIATLKGGRRTLDTAALKGGGPSVQILLTRVVRKESARAAGQAYRYQ